MRRLLTPLLLAAFLSTSAKADPLELDPVVAANVLAIHAQNPELRDDAFAKMGGSSVASKAFLYCFATPYVDLGDHADLQETIDQFRTGRRNSFNRQSLAAGVSWNLRYVIGGRPAHFREEIDATRARWALIFFGGNDAQNQNERVYARRLVYLVEQLAAMGVVPVLGSASPRRNKTKDRWIQRFNAITRAVATHWYLPHVDYHGAMSELPRKGLARDGVHPNVLGRGGVRRACQLTEKGLRYGNNLRNFLTLEMLDALRRVVADTGTDSNADADADADAGADTDTGIHVDAGTHVDAGPDTDATVTLHDLPFSVVVEKSALGVEAFPAGCGGEPGTRAYRVSLAVEEPTRLRMTALDLDRYQPRVLWVRVGEDGARCVKRRTQTLEVAARPGLWDLIVQVPERGAEDGKMLILIDRNPR
ncbi:MAG: SGNH/GDSL hydrolase family protein [Myxococcales bacterium]|nr:SGNH/GDSL hydrolase family protein [Myxococcales bacterium]MDH3485529.1 SGNH/GDSL hydrolase family protein [Myxococcales bacterium]